MADMNQSPVPEQEPKKRNNRSIIYIVLIIALVLLDGYWYFKNHQSQQQVSSQGQTINADSVNIVSLDDKYHSEMDSLYSYKGQNATLDSLLKIKIIKLSQMEKGLASAIKTKKFDDALYQKNIDTLNAMVSDFKNQIADLRSKNGILISKNDSLGKSLEITEGNNTQLTQANTTLGTKLTKASLLVPVNITGEAIKLNSSDKESNTSNNKKAKRIKVAFDVPANNTIDAGDKTFYLVLMDPKGTVLSDQAQGSGVFQTAESSTQQQYTTSKTVSFNEQKMHVEIEWNNPAGFDQGDYIAEIFQDGYLTAKSVIKLK